MMAGEKFDAPCIGGPLEGSRLPFEQDGSSVQPKFWAMSNGRAPLGYYEFIPSNAERFGTGESWRWHGFIYNRKAR